VRYEDLADVECSITRPLVVLGDRWTLLVLKQCFAGTRRFSALLTELGISRSRLVDRLARLVDHGLLRHVDGEYRLTAKGHDVYPVLMALRDFGDKHMAPDGPPFSYRHVDCGGEAHVTIRCERCEAALTARDVTLELGPGLQVDGDESRVRVGDLPAAADPGR
jgi:DNA-binding HxlR family transcriptional regulator